MNRSCQTGFGCYCVSARCRRLWRDSKIKIEFAKRKTLKSEQKECVQREGHAGWASRVYKLPKAGDVKNGTAGL